MAVPWILQELTNPLHFLPNKREPEAEQIWGGGGGGGIEREGGRKRERDLIFKDSID